MNPGHRPDERLDVLDGLRGIAIAWVLWFHAWQIAWLPAPALAAFGLTLSLQPLPETGWLGVDLFFFLSGFCVFWPYARASFAQRPMPTLAHFLDRRVRKIVPSYLAAIAILIALGFAHWPNLREAARDVVFHVLFIHNWFGATFGTIDGVMWSLGTEIQFYVAFPLLAWAMRRRPLVTWVVACALALAWRLRAEALGTYWLDDLLSQLPAVLDLFATGMLTAWAVAAIRARAPGFARARGGWTALALAGCAGTWLLVLGCFTGRYADHAFDHWRVLATFPLALCFGAGTLGAAFALRPLQRVLANPVLVWLALVSYNVYLWHVPVLRFWVGRGPFSSLAALQADPALGARYFLVAIPCALAVGTFFTYALERPLLRASFRRSRRTPERAGVAVAHRQAAGVEPLQ